VWVAGNLPGNALGSCYITWTRAAGQFMLLDDAGLPSVASQNSQCSLNVASARATDSGNNLTLSLPITFKPVFGGSRGIWMIANGSASSSTLAQLGTWTVPGPVVTNTSISPVSGNGAAQIFNAVWTDTAGSANIATASLWLTGSSTAASAHSCYITWSRATNQFTLQVTETESTFSTACNQPAPC